jgi:hypothetical protein
LIEFTYLKSNGPVKIRVEWEGQKSFVGPRISLGSYRKLKYTVPANSRDLPFPSYFQVSLKENNMDLTRRGFLRSGAITAVSAGIVISSSRLGLAESLIKSKESAIPTLGEVAPGFSFTSETFAHYVGETFKAPNARGKMVSLKLADVHTYKAKRDTKISTRSSKDLRSFSLSFSSKQRLPPFQSIHKLSHPTLGRFDLFLKPTELKNGTFVYEAAFSHV